MPPKYPGQSSRPGPAGGKLIKGLVDPSKANRIRIRKRDVSAPAPRSQTLQRARPGPDGMVRQGRSNTASASITGRRSTAASAVARASATTTASGASAGTARERRGASTIASGPRKLRPARAASRILAGGPCGQRRARLPRNTAGCVGLLALHSVVKPG
jgi:hypothetical protein